MLPFITALLLGAQIAESDYSHFQKLMAKETEVRSADRYAEAELLGREAEAIARRLPDSGSCSYVDLERTRGHSRLARPPCRRHRVAGEGSPGGG